MFLRGIYDRPIPAAGLAESRQQFALIAAVRAKDLERATSYVEAMKWPEGAKPELVRTQTSWREALEIAKRLRLGDASAFPALLPVLSQFPTQKEDVADHVYGPLFVLQTAASYLKTQEPKFTLLLIDDMKDSPGAGEFWHGALLEVAKSPDSSVESLEPFTVVLQSIALGLGLPAMESDFWQQAASECLDRSKNPEDALPLARKALEAAKDDASRMAATQGIVKVFAKSKKYDQAVEAAAACLARVKDPKVKDQLSKLVDSLKYQVQHPEVQASRGVQVPVLLK